MHYHESLHPDTAPKDRSIWAGIDRASFERQTEELSKQYVSIRQVYAETSSLRSEHAYPLSFGLEKSLADDFAFVAAFQPRVKSVSAVAIELDTDQPRFKVKLAANQGVAPCVERTFDDLFEVLRKHARKGETSMWCLLVVWRRLLTREDVTREACQAQLLELFIQLNCNKILGRLGSTKFRRPRHLPKNWKPLPARFRKIFDTDVGLRCSNQNRTELDRLDDQIKGFEAAFKQLEGEERSEELLRSIGNAIKRAHDLTVDGVGLPNRLENLGCSIKHLDARDVREIGKVANYWRISRFLTSCSQRFRRLFENAEWSPLVKYSASSKSPVIPRQFVHAEIQILVHYELTSPSLVPRAIGVSKEACFLCDTFIHAHGRFSITGAHRQMFNEWTVPDLKEYDWPTISHFRRALSVVCTKVKDEYQKSRSESPHRPFPLQSAINLNVAQLQTPSVSILSSQPGTRSTSGSDTVRTEDVSDTSTLSQVKKRLGLLNIDSGNHSVSRAPSSLISNDEQQVSERSHRQAHIENPIEVSIDDSVSTCRNWVHISGLFSDSPSIDPPTAQGRRFQGGSICLESSSNVCQRTMILADLSSKDELVVEKGPNDDSDELSFVLMGARGQKIGIRCRWYE